MGRQGPEGEGQGRGGRSRDDPGRSDHARASRRQGPVGEFEGPGRLGRTFLPRGGGGAAAGGGGGAGAGGRGPPRARPSSGRSGAPASIALPQDRQNTVPAFATGSELDKAAPLYGRRSRSAWAARPP